MTSEKAPLTLQAENTGFECDTLIENVSFHTTLTSEVFLPNRSPHHLPHNHSEFEGHLVTGTNAKFVTSSGILNLEKNDFCLLAPQMYHHIEEGEAVSTLSFSFSFSEVSRPHSADLYRALREKTDSLTEPVVLRRAFALAHALFSLTEEMGHGALGKADRLAFKTAEVLFALLDGLCPEVRGEYKEQLSPATRQRLTIDAFFMQNYEKDVTVRDLAEAIYLSERQTNRVLSELYGLSFKQKLIETRIHTAMQFLISSNRPISEIAEKSGYRSAVGFHTAFRQITGMTPAKYRSMMRRKQP